jgi:methyltransferase family protein
MSIIPGPQTMSSNDKSHWNSRFTNTDPEALTWFDPEAEATMRLLGRFGGANFSGLIDVGAGNSRLVDALLDTGADDLTLFDISDAALAQTRDRLGPRTEDVTFISGDIRDWQPERQWTIWHDRAVFHFMVSDEDQAAYISALDLATRAGALILLATFSPEGPEKCSGLPVARHDGQSLSNRLGRGYRLLHEERRDHITPGGTAQNFTHAVFRKT